MILYKSRQGFFLVNIAFHQVICLLLLSSMSTQSESNNVHHTYVLFIWFRFFKFHEFLIVGYSDIFTNKEEPSFVIYYNFLYRKSKKYLYERVVDCLPLMTYGLKLSLEAWILELRKNSFNDLRFNELQLHFGNSNIFCKA